MTAEQMKLLEEIKSMEKEMNEIENTMTKEERLKRLEDYGYSPIHLFKNWFLVRPVSKFYCRGNPLKKIAKHLRIVVKVESDRFSISRIAIKPKGALRID